MSKIVDIQVDEKTGDVTFYFDDSNEPWSANEFIGETSDRLIDIETSIWNFNMADIDGVKELSPDE